MIAKSNSQLTFGMILISMLATPACANYDSGERIAVSKQEVDVFNGVNWNGVNWNGVNWNGVNWNGVNWNGVNWNGVNWNGVNWNGVNWNGVNWNGVNWNGVNWNGVNWNGIDWANVDTGAIDWQAIDWQGVTASSIDWSQVEWSDAEWTEENFQGIASDWAGLGWFVNGQDADGSDIGAFVVTNPSIRAWIYDATSAEQRADRLHLLGKMVQARRARTGPCCSATSMAR